MSLIHLFKKLKHFNFDIIGYSLIGAGCSVQKDQELAPAHQIVQKIPENICPCFYLLIEQVNRTQLF